MNVGASSETMILLAYRERAGERGAVTGPERFAVRFSFSPWLFSFLFSLLAV